MTQEQPEPTTTSEQAQVEAQIAAALVAMSAASGGAQEQDEDSGVAVWLWPRVGPLFAAWLTTYLISLFEGSGAARNSTLQARIGSTGQQTAREILGEVEDKYRAAQAAVEAQDGPEAAKRARSTQAAREAREGATRGREEASVSVASSVGAVRKTWRTRGDSKVRDSHRLLNGVSVPMDGYFTTIMGVRLRHPGDERADISERAGCRCRLSYQFIGGFS